jgi:acyl-CoA synthetase (AMP-forming)/AMP-acid ligase II
MSIALYEILLSIFRAKLVAMFLDPSAGPKHLEQCCEINPPAAFIGSAKAHLLLLRSSVLRKIPRRINANGWIPGSIPWSRHLSTEKSSTLDLPEPTSPALITFTSGSTGQPKAAVRTHSFLLAQHRVLQKSISLTPGEIDLTTLPIFTLANLASGVTSVIPDADLRSPGHIKAAPVLEQIRRLNITRTAASPAFYEQLATTCEKERPSILNLRKIYTGGAPVFPNLLKRLQNVAPNATVTAVYGSTEAEPIAHLDLDKIAPNDFAHMNSGGGLLTGHATPEIELRILKDQWGTPLGQLTKSEFDSATLPPNEIGEIVVTGDHVLKSYFRNVGNNETKFQVDGITWHRTGDSGYLDNQNRLWLMGRCAARVTDTRGIIYPFAVECVAQQYETIHRCAFIGHQNHRILAVQLSPGITSLPTSLAETLQWANLDEIQILPEIPVDKRHNAKIDYPRLREMIEKRAY